MYFPQMDAVGIEQMTWLAVFHVAGAAIGKGRPRFARRGAHVIAYTPEKTKAYESEIKAAAMLAMAGNQVAMGAVYVDIVIHVEPPASWSKKRRAEALADVTFPMGKPDIDNVTKGILDAMNGIVYGDDKQVVQMTVVKRYFEPAGVVVRVGIVE